MPLVMISGSPKMVDFAEENELQLLRKPFKAADLSAAIEKALSSGAFELREEALRLPHRFRSGNAAPHCAVPLGERFFYDGRRSCHQPLQIATTPCRNAARMADLLA